MFRRLYKKYSSLSQLRKNVLSGSIMSAINMGVLVVSYPIYLYFLGAEYYGLWTTLAVIVAAGELGYLGISQSIIKFIAEEWGKQNKLGITGYITNAFLMISIPFIIFISATYFARFSIAGFFHLEGAYFRIAAQLIPNLALLTLAMFSALILQGVMMGIGRVDFANYLLVLSNIAKVGAACLLLFLNLGLWALLIASFFQYGLLFVVCLIHIIHRSKIKVFSLRCFDKAKIRKLLSFGINIVGTNLLNIALVPIIKIFITRYIGLAEVTFFDLALKGVRLIRNLVDKGIFAIMPKISEVSAMQDGLVDKKITGIHDKAVKFILFVGVPAFIFGFLFSNFVIKIWLQNQYVSDISILFKYFSVATGVSIIFVPAYYTLMGIGKVRFCMFHNAIKTAFVLVFIGSFYFLKIYRIEYIALAFSVSMVLSHLYLGYVYLSTFKKSYSWLKPVLF